MDSLCNTAWSVHCRLFTGQLDFEGPPRESEHSYLTRHYCVMNEHRNKINAFPLNRKANKKINFRANYYKLQLIVVSDPRSIASGS